MATRGPYSKSASTREHILDAALAIIGSSGYTGATLQQIADAVGMSKPGVLHHFGSRDALFVAVLARRDEVYGQDFGHDDDPVGSLLASVRRNTDVPGLVALFSGFAGIGATDATDTAPRTFLLSRYPVLVDSIAQAVRDQQAEGVIAADRDPETIARLLVAASDGLQTQWLLDPSIDMAAHLEALWALVTSAPPTAVP
jgi:AcrR family transcriptional regulator